MTRKLAAPTDDEVLAQLSRIRRAPGQEGAYAPHKPLTLLLALGRLQRGEARMVPFRQVEAQMGTLLTEFAKTGSAANRNMPFWRLKNDADHALWQVQDPTGQLSVDAVDQPTLTRMRQSALEGGFAPAVHQALATRPELLIRAAQQILESNFPQTLHPDIAQAVGLDLTPLQTGVQEPEPAGRYASGPPPLRRRRDPAFRESVLRAYEYRCCVCGFDLRVGHLPAGLEAAHIQWHTVGGPDEVPNGLSLCALHHKLFDLGAFTVSPEDLRIQFSQHAIAGDRGLSGELRHHGQALMAPQHREMRPGNSFLQWNVKNVFKGPARQWGP